MTFHARGVRFFLAAVLSAAGASRRATAQPLTAEIELTAAPAQAQLLPGAATGVLQYTGRVLSGPPSVLEKIPGSYLGPIIRLSRGDRVRIRFRNEIGDPSIVHWHGLLVPEAADGHPRSAIASGAEYDYEFTVINRAGTYWYHPHPDTRTGPQVYRGLAGLLIVSDPEEGRLALPRGDFDVPFVIQDRRFDAGNQLLYDTGDMMGGFLGDRILLNGRIDATFPAATRVYRFRFLNGSNSRTYKLAWGDGSPMVVIGTDGGLLSAPAERPYAMLGPGERVEVWADLSHRPVGSNLVLKSLAFSPGGMGGGRLPDGAAFDIMRVTVERTEPETLTLPATLIPITRYRLEEAVNRANPRAFAISFSMGRWLLNGRTFEMKGIAPNEIVLLGDLEAWEFLNTSGMPMMQMLHPLHVHAVQFQIYERTINASGADNYATVRDGFIDTGWKDTLILMPGERAKVLMRFWPYPGLFLYHCHNLEHEDQGMMRNFRIDGGVPVVIQDLTATSSPQRVLLSWRLSSAALDEVRSVLVERSYESLGPYVHLTVLHPEASMQFEDRPVEAGRSYWYRLVLESPDGALTVAGTIQVHVEANLWRNELLAPTLVRGSDPVAITYRIGGEGGSVRLEIYNVAGALVRRLERAQRSPGEYLARWDLRTKSGEEAARGMYLVKLAVANQILTSKMVLLP